MKLLLIEDNLDHQEIVSDIWEPDLGQVLIETSLEAGTNRLKEDSFDICLCDLSLPDSDIENTIKILGALDTLTPVVVLTSLDDEASERILLQSGIQDYVPKYQLSANFLRRVCRHAIERKHLLNEIEGLAREDALTGLHNRREFERNLVFMMSDAKRKRHPLSLCMFDLDYFKEINDSYGHQTGDEALKLVSAVLRESSRDTDLPCRFGGDEFVLLMPHCNVRDAENRCNRLLKTIRSRPLQTESTDVLISLSIGVTEFINGDTPDQFLKRADSALYQSKEQGRGRTCVVDPNDLIIEVDAKRQ